MRGGRNFIFEPSTRLQCVQLCGARALVCARLRAVNAAVTAKNNIAVRLIFSRNALAVRFLFAGVGAEPRVRAFGLELGAAGRADGRRRSRQSPSLAPLVPFASLDAFLCVLRL